MSAQNIKFYLVKFVQRLWTISLRQAAREQRLADLITTLKKIVPDINSQYTRSKISGSYMHTKIRGQHAFQISLVNEILEDFSNPVIVDIGDSAGTHLQYLKGIHEGKKSIECLSVNLDAEAINRIKAKGLRAIHARAEDIESYNIRADIFLGFAILEHLMDPCRFLYNLSSKTQAKYFILTVPYLRRSRVGLHYVKKMHNDNAYAEDTHIFELSPEDWKSIARHSGWDVVKEKVYLQYPKRNLLGITRVLWRKFDFEGFYGLILRRENKWSSKYVDW